MGQDSQQLIAPLQSILRVADSIKEVTAGSNSSGHSFPRTSDLFSITDSVNLPSPSPLLPLLLMAGANSEVASTASQIYQRCAEQFRRRIQESITTACRGVAEFPTSASLLPPDLLVKKVTSVFTEVYVQRLEQWKQESIGCIQKASTTPVKVASTNPYVFNHQYVPLLEHFFKVNPFPTQADKMFLAKKSNMQYRQIHVWFQNRRNRTKKEGKMLRKGPSYESATKPLDKLYKHMKSHIVDSDFQVPKFSESSSSEGTAENSISKDVFASSSPPHAYPSSYPPTCRYDPFPCKSGLGCFPLPEWRRVSDCRHPPSLSTGTDDLVEMFSRLHVRDRTHSKGSPKSQSHAATIAITVIPPSAPHPSLIARKYSQLPKIVRLRPSVSAPVSCPRAFRSPSPTSKPVTLVPSSGLSDKSELPRKRKIAPLPRRHPGQMQTVRRDARPLESSLTSSPLLFSAGSDTRSCSSASISSVSMPSDAASIQELPHLSGLPCRSLFGNPIHLYGLGDMAAVSPSFAS